MKLTYEESLKNFENTFNKSKEYANHSKDYIPGSYSRRTFNYGPHAIFVDRGEGQYIYTIDGKKLLDLSNNFSVNVLGQNHPAIINAVNKAMEKGFSFGNPTFSEAKLAKLLCDRVESFDKVKFFCSASEACAGAVRIARGYTGKNKIAKFEGGYHGFFDDLAISAHPTPELSSDSIEDIKPLPDSEGIPKDIVDSTVILTQNNFEVCEKIIRENADELACIILELQSCAGGIVVLEKEFISSLRKLTTELGILLIFDETITLRAEPGGFQSRYDAKPDLTVMGKIIGGGFPCGAIAGSNEVLSVVESDRVQISGTHHGHNLVCEAGVACLEALDKDACAHINGLSEKLKNELNEWAKEKGYPFIIFGEFSVLGYAFTNELGQEIKTHRDYWDITDAEKMQIYALEIATRGYLPVHRGQLGLTVPMTDEDIEGFIDATKDIVTRIYED